MSDDRMTSVSREMQLHAYLLKMRGADGHCRVNQAELGQAFDPPVTQPGISYCLRKLIYMGLISKCGRADYEVHDYPQIQSNGLGCGLQPSEIRDRLDELLEQLRFQSDQQVRVCELLGNIHDALQAVAAARPESGHDDLRPETEDVPAPSLGMAELRAQMEAELRAQMEAVHRRLERLEQAAQDNESSADQLGMENGSYAE